MADIPNFFSNFAYSETYCGFIKSRYLMNAKLIYIFVLSFATFMLAACSEDDVPDVVDTAKGSELIFDVADQSRALATNVLSFNGSKFAIYGNMRFMDNDPIVIFNKTPVTYNNGKWRYGEVQYWFPKHNHSFIAVHPADAGISDAKYSDSRLTFTYTLPDDFQSAQDLLVATHRRMYEEDTQSEAAPVTLKFWHILSRVNFNVKDEGAADLVRVNKIVLEGINKRGTFSIIPAPVASGSKQTDDYVYSWSNISKRGDLTANIQVEIPENDERPLFPDNNALLMIPQPDNNDVIMYITYTLIDAGSNDETLTLTAQAPIGGWEPGKEYNYTIAISEITKEISVTVNVKNWQTPNPFNITVPES